MAHKPSRSEVMADRQLERPKQEYSSRTLTYLTEITNDLGRNPHAQSLPTNDSEDPTENAPQDRHTDRTGQTGQLNCPY